ncbi:MAG: serpin family protein [Thermoplasmatota archaeon]
MEQKTKRNTIIAGVVFVNIILLGSAGIYYFFIRDTEDYYELNIGDRVLIDDDSTDAGVEDIVSGHNQFAVDLYRELVNGSRDNLIFSPLSLYIVLSILYEGAGGETAQQIKEALYLMDDDETRRSSFSRIQNELDGREGRVDIALANGLFVQDGMDLREAFRQMITDHYFAETENMDFSSDPEGCRKSINEWGSEKTNGLIPQALPSGTIDPSTVMAILNAIYFKGEWDIPFDKGDTYDQNFYLTENRTKEVPMMHFDPDDVKNDVDFLVYEGEDVESLELLYKGGSISMTFYRSPQDGGEYYMEDRIDPESIFELEKDLSGKMIGDAQEGASERELTISLPKFSMDPEMDLEAPLRSLGIENAFGPADFSNITGSAGLFIGSIGQSAKIKVDEKGTEAAAVTYAAMDRSIGLSFDLNQPFIFTIQDRETGLILFMGRVMEPTWEE